MQKFNAHQTMILSMTGYGKSIVTYNEKKINVEIKSLNSKALDLSARIAPLYREKEMEMRQMIAAALIRGKVDFAIWIEKDEIADATPINAALVENYYHQLREIQNRVGIPEPQDWFQTLLRMPDVTTTNEVEILTDEEWETARQAIEQALNALVEFRKQEGIALQKKFIEKIDNISALLTSIEPYEKSRIEKIRARIIEGLNTIPEIDYDQNRLEQELIYYIEKLDISEEKQRLANHLKYFRETMNEGYGQGKKLGFIAQEMGREINTTGAKSNQAEMQNIVVKMKDELEQIKEQVLNAL
ncbi:TIGR00255 family protein [Hoylesella pleuritidis F0068]|uniref:TIGR00255 family protein n=2 Tax=Hoylesella pleuritidis TaxID=407975 RepID=U2MYJ3_9BACT|nr:TIGR00255 family protein [Hoylesella pleuritidis F0068]